MTCHPWRKTKLTAQPAVANESNDKKLEIWPQLNYKAVPDLVGTEATLFKQYHKWKDARTKLSNSRGFPWHHVRTIVELRSDTVDKSERQTATYTGDIHHSRADLAGAYGLYASLKDYSIHWSDCTGAYKSPRFQWSNLDPLIQYVKSLYEPPDGHRDAHDQTVELDLPPAGEDPPRVFIPDDPHWRFTTLPHCSFRVTFVGPVHSRGTRVFEQQRYPEEQKAPLIVKEVYVPEPGRRYDEAGMLKELHKKGPLQGCLRGIRLEPGPTARTPIWPTKGGAEAKQKQRLLCFDTGKILDKAPSVLGFLEATFDSLEREQFLAGCIHTQAVLTESLKSTARHTSVEYYIAMSALAMSISTRSMCTSMDVWTSKR